MPGEFSMDKNTILYYIPTISKTWFIFYWIFFGWLLLILILLPIVGIDISVKANGMVRPIRERTELKSIYTGIIDTVFFKDGDQVHNGDIVLRIKNPNEKIKIEQFSFEMNQRQQFVLDLQLLTSPLKLTGNLLNSLHTPIYRGQLNRLLHQISDRAATLAKADKELEMNTTLVKDRVISPKEFFDLQNNQQRIQFANKAFLQEQIGVWQQELIRYRMEISQYQSQIQELHNQSAHYLIKAPVGGIIQGLNNYYAGGTLAANEVLCVISPEEQLVGECFLPSRDIGLLQKGQLARFQFDAFDYNYFGYMTGRVWSIDNDFTIVNNEALIKVRCAFDSTTLQVKSGYRGQLRKGLNFQAGFIIARRTLWQLLFDKLDDWLNPSAPSQKRN